MPMPVRLSADFTRIRQLPRRVWLPSEIEELIDELQKQLALPGCAMRLFPAQALLLVEAYAARGLLGAAGVGHGKTLVSFLLPTLLESKRPLLIVPANLREKTYSDFQELAKHYKTPENMTIISYAKLSRVSGAQFLHEYEPDLIIADECHKLKARQSARTRRFAEFMKTDNPVFCGLSGTMTRRSIEDYSHMSAWALGDSSPVPLVRWEAKNWARALDSRVEHHKRLDPGVLWLFCRQEDGDAGDISTARRGFRRRFAESCGVVCTEESALACSLSLERRRIAVPEEIRKHLTILQKDWVTPTGDELPEPILVWMQARQLCQGFYYEWEPPPPPAWMEARRLWNKFVRETLKAGIPGLDSPLQIANRYDDHPLLANWRKIRHTYDYELVPKWLSDYMLEDAMSWLDKTGGIAWVEHNAVGERLSRLSGLPYLGAGPKANNRLQSISGPFIASIKAHGTGKNLQRYSKNLVMSAPPAGATWEQLLGRTHRPGQEADEVSCEIYIPDSNVMDGFKQAMADARYIHDSTGQQQKLLYADLIDFNPII